MSSSLKSHGQNDHGLDRASLEAMRHATTSSMPSLSSTRIPIPLHLLSSTARLGPFSQHTRLFSTTARSASRESRDDISPFPPLSASHPTTPSTTTNNNNNDNKKTNDPEQPRLTHLSPTGEAHMVSIAHKQPTTRTATAACTVHFSGAAALRLVRENGHRKGDVLGVARIAGIMAAKRTPDIIPLCHPVMLSHVSVDLAVGDPGAGAGGAGGDRLEVSATVTCDGKTGVEMEALTAASAAALTVYDMCKAVDKGMRIEGLRVVAKEGGKSGRWVEGIKTD